VLSLLRTAHVCFARLGSKNGSPLNFNLAQRSNKTSEAREAEAAFFERSLETRSGASRVSGSAQQCKGPLGASAGAQRKFNVALKSNRFARNLTQSGASQKKAQLQLKVEPSATNVNLFYRAGKLKVDRCTIPLRVF
jgi:hypothetical protein